MGRTDEGDVSRLRMLLRTIGGLANPFGPGREARLARNLDALGRCGFCGEWMFFCPECHGPVSLHEVVDIFHVGDCPACGVQDLPCPVRVA